MITLFSVAFAVIIGLLMTRVIKRFGLPAVTAYLIAGVLIGPYGLYIYGADGEAEPDVQCGAGLHRLRHRQ